MELCYIGVQTEIFAFLQGGTGAELVEDMVIPLRDRLEDDTRPFKQVCPDTCADDFLFAVE